MNNDDVKSVVTGFLIFFAYTFVYFIGYSSGRKDEEKEQEKYAFVRPGDDIYVSIFLQKSRK